MENLARSDAIACCENTFTVETDRVDPFNSLRSHKEWVNPIIYPIFGILIARVDLGDCFDRFSLPTFWDCGLAHPATLIAARCPATRASSPARSCMICGRVWP